MDRKSFVLYTASKEIIDLLSDEQTGKLFKAILEYTTGGEVPDMDGMTLIVFTTIKTYLDKDYETYEAKCTANRENGRKGGRPKKTEENRTVIEENRRKPNGFKNNPKNLEYEYEYEYEYDSEYEDIKGATPDVKKKPHSRFKPPTVDEVREYCELEGYKVDAQRFIDYYEARGWELSKGRKCKSWKACVRTWNGNSKTWEKEEKAKKGVTVNEEQRSGYISSDEFFEEE